MNYDVYIPNPQNNFNFFVIFQRQNFPRAIGEASGFSKGYSASAKATRSKKQEKNINFIKKSFKTDIKSKVCLI